jgi:hypothetical protein
MCHKIEERNITIITEIFSLYTSLNWVGGNFVFFCHREHWKPTTSSGYRKDKSDVALTFFDIKHDLFVYNHPVNPVPAVLNLLEGR